MNYIFSLLHILGRWQSKTSILSTKVEKKSSETESLISICRPSGNKWQAKTLFLAIFDPHSANVKTIFDCRIPSVCYVCILQTKKSLILVLTLILPVFYSPENVVFSLHLLHTSISKHPPNYFHLRSKHSCTPDKDI